MKLLRLLLGSLCGVPIGGTLLSLSRHPHWIFRVWDFPRVQLATMATLSAVAYRAFAWRGKRSDRFLMAASAATVGWHLYRIRTYTRLTRPRVRRATKSDPENRIVLMMTNVLEENRQYERLLERVKIEDPDVVIAVEVDDRWMRALEPLASRYPHAVRRPLNNTYGMVLFSRLELIDPRIEFLVEDDIPSIHTRLRLRSGVEVTLHALHPRPPEPLHDQDSAARDAELVIVGKHVAEEEGPIIVAGDLNDVAWSDTSELFVRLSGLLDPRAGRGLYNSFNAHHRLFRYPLDHVFHSKHFKLVRIERLPDVGSDHFPILIELQYEAEAAEEQEESETKPGDEKLAKEKLEDVSSVSS
ncbi:MAG TPA: endonuclease/exonuclease/phosphatase family protein [Thermoanaerobaculia bacterium]|nr:endonuclease/exonuclease/phosphatase family protein [Thermoanaerobaculia bacterium]